MITQVWTYDENYIYTGQKIVEEIGENMTNISPLSNGTTGTMPYRPRFDIESQKWVEDMTDEEIEKYKEQQEKIRPKVKSIYTKLEMAIADLEIDILNKE